MAIAQKPEQPVEGGEHVVVAVVEPVAKLPMRLLRPVAAPAEIVAAQNEARAMVHQALKEGRDFGVIPGTDKPSLLKPGAERVALGFGCYYGEPIIVEKEIDHDREVMWTKTKWVTRDKPGNWEEVKAKGTGRNRKFDNKWVWQEREIEEGMSLGLYRYVVRVQVINRETSQIVGEGIGACSTLESKYIDRPRDSENTILKMAHKRAIVAACLVTFGLSDEFTQDVEDLPHLNGEASGAPPAPTPRPATSGTLITRASALTFGKHKGKALAEVSTDYLEWCVQPDRKIGPDTEAWQRVIREELAERLKAAESRELSRRAVPASDEDFPEALHDEPDDLPF